MRNWEGGEKEDEPEKRSQQQCQQYNILTSTFHVVLL